MISVLLFGSRTASGRPPRSEDVVRGLASLVPAAVEGVVREVQLLAEQAAQDTEDRTLAGVAEHAGCAYVAGVFPEILPRAAAAARSPFVLLLLAGASFDRALIDEMAAVATHGSDRIASGVALKALDGGLLGRLAPRLSPTVGLLTGRERLTGLRPASLEAFWRGLQARHTFTNRAWTAASR